MNLHFGMNDIPVSNSKGRCLLENWVEERATSHLSPKDDEEKYSSTAQLLKHGHKGLLTVDLQANSENVTTARAAYKTPKFPNIRTRGQKEELFEKGLFNKLVDEAVLEMNEPMPKPEYITIKQQDFDKPEFKTTHPPPTKDHDVNKEQSVTFWTTHLQKIHGVSQIKTRDTPFKKNSSFSKPMSEYLDQPQPYEDEAYPNL